MKKTGSNSVRPTGSHVSGHGTLTQAGTKAPTVSASKGNYGGIKSNGLMPANAGRTTMNERPPSHVKLDARKVVGEAHANQRGGFTKQLSSKESGPFRGAATAGGRAKAEGYSNNLKAGYRK